MAKLLKYRGILFDDWTDDFCDYWAEICAECAEKYDNLINNELKRGCACGFCSVAGCTNNDSNTTHYYIDFDMRYVEIIDTEEKHNDQTEDR